MMDMKDVSTFFDNDPLYDAYSLQYLYDGQFSTYDGSQLDGSFIRRRTVSLSPDLALPPRRAVNLYGEVWVLSDPILDGFLGETVRQTMSARKSHGLYGLKTLSELVFKRPASREAHGFKRWTKGTGDASTSDLEPYFEFSFALTEEPIRPLFITLGDQAWSGRMEADSGEGFRVVEADDIVAEDESFRYVEVTEQGKIDPVTLEESDQRTYPGLFVQRYKLFRKLDQEQPNNYHGDMTLLVANESMPKFVAPLTINGERWSVVASQPISDGLALHVRKV